MKAFGTFHMQNLRRLAEQPASIAWVSQFRTSDDRAMAASFLGQLKLVSSREFEVALEQSVKGLQQRLDEAIAVYPISPPNPDGVIGYDPFNGALTSATNRLTGRRQQHGSEGRVAHILTGLQRQFTRPNGTSLIECGATVRQIKTQKIRHIVLVDDICGSGDRIVKFWKNVVPKSIKSLLSFNRCQLWIVVFAVTAAGKKRLHKSLPNFPTETHLIAPHSEVSLREILSPGLERVFLAYAKGLGVESLGLGYRGSACSIVFEHGCPNNLPSVLWFGKKKGWAPLFPNRAIPEELKICFGGVGQERGIEALWNANQSSLALSLLEALQARFPLSGDHVSILTILGLKLRGVATKAIARRLLMSESEVSQHFAKAEEMGLYDNSADSVTLLGRDFVSRFRARIPRSEEKKMIDGNLSLYYPVQCDGERIELGKTERGSPPVPMDQKI